MWDGVRALLTSYESSGGKDFLNGVKELGIVDLFLKDWDDGKLSCENIQSCFLTPDLSPSLWIR